jgi:LssY C-terminus
VARPARARAWPSLPAGEDIGLDHRGSSGVDNGYRVCYEIDRASSGALSTAFADGSAREPSLSGERSLLGNGELRGVMDGPRGIRIVLKMLFLLTLVYGLCAYLIIPTVWRVEIARHPALQGAPRLTHTAAGLPGDPLNVALVALDPELMRALLAVGWHPADPITLETSLRIASSTLLHRPYVDAPVSHLYLWGRKEDLAFEQPVGPDPAQRHHVRFWRSAAVDEMGRRLWMGAATYDVRVGFSHTTGQITHHIAPNVDAERDQLMRGLQRAGWLNRVDWIADFHSARRGRNGGGDPYYTDGRMAVGIINPQQSIGKTDRARGLQR